MPSVTTSMRVREETRVSSRVRYPTVAPASSPTDRAMYCAAARAATRRGSSMMIFRPPSHGGVEQGERHARGLAGAGRGLQHHTRRAGQRGTQFVQDGVDR